MKQRHEGFKELTRMSLTAPHQMLPILENQIQQKERQITFLEHILNATRRVCAFLQL